MRPRQFLKVSVLRPYFPGGMFNVFTPALHIHGEYATPNMQRLRLGLPGYLIRFAPLAFVPDRQTCSGQMPSLLVVCQGLSHFTATQDIPLPPPSLYLRSIPCTLLS